MENGPEITNEEARHSLKNMKNGKATGPDTMPIELMKLINENNIQIITDLFNLIYKSGTIPKEWLVSTFIAILKKKMLKNVVNTE